jgi:hypothetical protein
MSEVYEIIGYTGSVLVALSLMMKNILRLRVINFFGAATFATYGYLVDAYPVLVLNGFITLVDVYYLVGMWRQKEHFSLMPVLDETHPYLSKFFEFHKNDIEQFFPGFDSKKLNKPQCFFILRNLIPAGLFVFEKIDNDTVFIHLDYAIPDYRDFKNAKYVYSAEQKYLMEHGIKKLTTKSSEPKHIKYLERMGFVKSKQNQNIFERTLS